MKDYQLAREVVTGFGVDGDVPLPEAIVVATENRTVVLERRLHCAINYAEQAIARLADDDPEKERLSRLLTIYAATPTSGEYRYADTIRKVSGAEEAAR